MANSFRVETYRSARPLSLVVIGLLAVQAVCYVLYTLLSIVQIAKPDMVLETDDGAGFPVPFMLIGLLSVVEWLARLGTIVLFLIWLYRAYANLSPLKARDLEFTPGWAVGWWFIPLANLIKPYQAVAEAWRESDPDYSEEYGFLTSSIENPWVFPIWWGSWILGNIIARIAEKAIDETISDAYPYLLILTSVFSGVAAAAAIWIVRETTRRQDLRFKRLEAGKVDLQPPPPPTFSQNM
jgi:hypothetical protein